MPEWRKGFEAEGSDFGGGAWVPWKCVLPTNGYPRCRAFANGRPRTQNANLSIRTDVNELWDSRITKNPSALFDRRTMSRNHESRRASAARVSSAVRLALAGVGERPKDCARVLVHNLTKVHGDREQEDQEEQVNPKE